MNELEMARTQINQIDEQMTKLFEERMLAVSKVVNYKLQNNLPIFDGSREQIVIEKNLANIKNVDYKEYYEAFIKSTMEISKKYQRTIANAEVVAYQGVEGAFSHIATKELFNNNVLKSFDTFEEVFKAVEKGEATYAVLPFENSYTGEVFEVFDLLYKYNSKINKVYELEINQNLLALPNTKMQDIKQVYSHHQAISQCKTFFEKYDNIELVPFLNTALAGKYVSEQNDKSKAAIASTQTAQLYGLEILAKNINTSTENTTRFIVISRNQNKKSSRFSIMFTINHNAGELANIIQVISNCKFNMDCIRSKSVHNVPWQYYFYIEIEGDIQSEATKDLISKLSQRCETFKVIGAY
ncbi:MAG: chorismate mutase [Oscillospiraceae bacterium]